MLTHMFALSQLSDKVYLLFCYSGQQKSQNPQLNSICHNPVSSHSALLLISRSPNFPFVAFLLSFPSWFNLTLTLCRTLGHLIFETPGVQSQSFVLQKENKNQRLLSLLQRQFEKNNQRRYFSSLFDLPGDIGKVLPPCRLLKALDRKCCSVFEWLLIWKRKR